MKWWHSKSKEITEEIEELTRGEVLMELFWEWGYEQLSTVFSYNILVGDCRIHRVAHREAVQRLAISVNNTIILSIAVRWGRDCGWRHAKPRTTVYDEAYSDQLDGYIDALRGAIAERGRVAQEESERAREQKLFEETRF